jgi:hypothetical protein
MSHVSDWVCRSCRAVLGHVRDGVLCPVVAVASINALGVARVLCPHCGRIRAWEPVGCGPLCAPSRPARQPDTASGPHLA